MAWHLLGKLTKKSVAHVTLVGKWWVGFIFAFRVIVIASVGHTAYRDEQDQFTCNTLQPGCAQVCYNEFAPISHIRFWVFQILATATPTVFFVIYATHKLAQFPTKPKGDEAKDEKTKKTVGESENEPKNKVCRENKVRKVKRKIIRVYAITLLLRTGAEVAFVYLQYYLYQWSVPKSYRCYQYPCPNVVDCFVSRPKEKTILLYFMFIVGIICILLDILEIIYLVYKKLKRKRFPVERRCVVPPSAIEEANLISEERSVMTHPKHAPPDYDILPADPLEEHHQSPESGVPPESFNKSESDLTLLGNSGE